MTAAVLSAIAVPTTAPSRSIASGYSAAKPVPLVRR